MLMLLLLASLLFAILMGVHVAFAMGGMMVLFTLLFWEPDGLSLLSNATWQTMSNILLIAIPLFLMMGNLLFYSKVADDLFGAIHIWSGRIRGSIAVTTVLVCCIFGMMTGVAAAAVTSMGMIAYPSMMKRKYKKNLALGVIPAGGSLAIIIPPSIGIIVYCMTTNESIAKMFLAGLQGGLTIGMFFCIYILLKSVIDPKFAPAYEEATQFSFWMKVKATKGMILPALIVLSVLGSIFSGLATPTEASALGVLACMFSVFILKRLNWNVIMESCKSTLSVSGMIAWLYITAMAFKSIWVVLGAQRNISMLIETSQFSPWVVLLIFFFILFLLGMILDPNPIILICGPIMYPIATMTLGFDSLWFSILFMMVVILGMITPPYGVSLFYLKSVTPANVSMGDIYRASMPFILIWLISMLVFMIFPITVTWLPEILMGE